MVNDSSIIEQYDVLYTTPLGFLYLLEVLSVLIYELGGPYGDCELTLL